MAVSVRKRFEVFKRDDFTCRYCGRKSPEVVLEVDHIVPSSAGGPDDEMNLVTSCWECNSGKSDKPLSQAITGEDPHDKAIVLLEKERQIREYNAVLQAARERVDDELMDLQTFWEAARFTRALTDRDRNWLRKMLRSHPAEAIRSAMSEAITYDKVDSLAYVNTVLRARLERGDSNA